MKLKISFGRIVANNVFLIRNQIQRKAAEDDFLYGRCILLRAVHANSADGSKKKIDTSFNNPIVAFKGKTTFELLRAYFVYLLLSIRPLVDNNMKIMKITNSLLGDKIFGLLMRSTFYGHFVGGANEKEILLPLKRMYTFGVKCILDYAAEDDISSERAESLEKKALENTKTELPQYQVPSQNLDRREKVVSARVFFYENESECEKNMAHFLRCIDVAATSTFNTGMSAIKLTALCKPKILLQISEVITKSRRYLEQIQRIGDSSAPVIKHHVSKEKLQEYLTHVAKDQDTAQKFLNMMTSDDEGIIHLFPWSGILNDEFEVNETFQVLDLNTGEMVRFMTQLTKEEIMQFKNMIRRFNTVLKCASDANVEVMVDAEQTYFQPAISRLTIEMMSKYNKGKGIVFNTYQNYLLNSYDEVVADLEQARRQNFFFRCKLVRGAYMEQERERALSMNYQDPIQPTVEASTENYHRTFAECLRQIKQLKEQGVKEKRIVIMVASHNEDTIRLAIDKMEEMGIGTEDQTVLFGQLLGMCDFISYSLADSGCQIYKYVPFGPVKEVLPYLSRRATENRGILRNIKKEKRMLRKEIMRRLMTLDMNSNPVGPIPADDEDIKR